MADISRKIERKVALVDENKSVLDAACVMVERFIGSVVVTGASGIKGIFTERDLMRVVAQQQDPARTPLRDVMGTEPPVVNPSDSIEECLERMRANRCRHLLVFERNEFVGIVSLRDLAALMLEEKEALVQDLTKYITG